jgi:hypothetical protein
MTRPKALPQVAALGRTTHSDSLKEGGNILLDFIASPDGHGVAQKVIPAITLN